MWQATSSSRNSCPLLEFKFNLDPQADLLESTLKLPAELASVLSKSDAVTVQCHWHLRVNERGCRSCCFSHTKEHGLQAAPALKDGVLRVGEAGGVELTCIRS